METNTKTKWHTRRHDEPSTVVRYCELQYYTHRSFLHNRDGTLCVTGPVYRSTSTHRTIYSHHYQSLQY